MQKPISGYKLVTLNPKVLKFIIPEEWNFVKFNRLTVKITDGTHFTPKYVSEGIPFLRVTDIQTKIIEWKSVKKISSMEHLELIKRCNPEKGDILFSKNGTIGITTIVDWDQEFSIFVSLCLIKPLHEKIKTKYLYWVLLSRIIKIQIELRSKQLSVQNLHLEEIRDFDIPLPSLNEQQKIASILSKIDASHYNTLKNHLKLDVLTIASYCQIRYCLFEFCKALLYGRSQIDSIKTVFVAHQLFCNVIVY